jgi:hypothetical protein
MSNAISAAGVEGTASGAVELLGMISANWMSQAICVAAELQIPDFLASGPRHVDDLARMTECDVGSLNRLMRALSSLGICNELGDGFFELFFAEARSTRCGVPPCGGGGTNRKYGKTFSTA